MYKRIEWAASPERTMSRQWAFGWWGIFSFHLVAWMSGWNWLPPANGHAKRLGGRCWFTPEGWAEMERRGLLRQVEEHLISNQIPYRVVRCPLTTEPLYKDSYQAILPVQRYQECA